MSISAGQSTDGTLPTVLGEVDSIDGVPVGKTLTQKQLRDAANALQQFIDVIKKEPAVKAAVEKAAIEKAGTAEAATAAAAEKAGEKEATAKAAVEREVARAATEKVAAEKAGGEAATAKAAAEKAAAKKAAAKKAAADWEAALKEAVANALTRELADLAAAAAAAAEKEFAPLIAAAEASAAEAAAEMVAAEKRAAEAAATKVVAEKVAALAAAERGAAEKAAVEAAATKVAAEMVAAERAAATRIAAEKVAAEKAAGEKELPPGPHCFVVAGGLGFRNSEKTESTEQDVRNYCDKYFGYPEKPREITIHVILDSGGGSLDTAFKIARILRRFAAHIVIYVPRRAKSAATLIAIGSDEVFMAPYAELGPLDTQIKDPRDPTKTVSALDCYQSAHHVREFGLGTLPKVLGVLLRETEARIPMPDLINIATDFALDEVTPILGQVNAVDFGGWGRTMKIGEMYALALQQRLGHASEKKAAEIAEKLVYGYPHHSFFIDLEEATKVGLNVSMMSEDEYRASLKVAEACEGGRCVGFIDNIWEMAQKAPIGDS